MHGKFFLKLAAISFTLLLNAPLAVSSESGHATPEFCWGGPGYDSEVKPESASSRFCAHASRYEKDKIEITVDSRATAKQVKAMTLVDSDKHIYRSLYCWKLFQRPTSPWSCSFSKSTILALKGNGALLVWDADGNRLVQSAVHFKDLKNTAI